MDELAVHRTHRALNLHRCWRCCWGSVGHLRAHELVTCGDTIHRCIIVRLTGGFMHVTTTDARQFGLSLVIAPPPLPSCLLPSAPPATPADPPDERRLPASSDPRRLSLVVRGAPLSPSPECWARLVKSVSLSPRLLASFLLTMTRGVGRCATPHQR